MLQSERPHIYAYLNYREFLKDLFSFKKRVNAGFSHRSFSRLAGLKSSSFLKFVMDGKKNLSTEMIPRFAKAFKLTKAESAFFMPLVLFCQAKTADEKNYYYERIAHFKNYTQARQIENCQYDYFSKWHYVAIRELVNLGNFREDPNWINRKLKIRLTSEEVQKAIQTLIDLKLLRRDGLGRLKQTSAQVVTAPEIASLAVLNFYKEMIRRAGASLEESHTAHREVGALTVSVSRERFERIRERLCEFRREIHLIAADDPSPEAVYQLNLQFFNLSEVPWN